MLASYVIAIFFMHCGLISSRMRLIHWHSRPDSSAPCNLGAWGAGGFAAPGPAGIGGSAVIPRWGRVPTDGDDMGDRCGRMRAQWRARQMGDALTLDCNPV